MTESEIKELLLKHKSFTANLENLLRSLLLANGIKFHIIESRTKDYESLREKITRKNISDIKSEITDLTGLRVILYYLNDVEKVEQIVSSNFKIDESNSIDKAKILNHNEFGYLSVHYILQLDNQRNKLQEWNGMGDLKAEVQVRTILQHSWASISHELSYKRENEIPDEISRKLYRLAGLFELADEQFEQIKSSDIRLDEHYITKREEKEFDEIKLNLKSLQTDFSNEESEIKTALSIGYEIGFGHSGKDYYDSDLSQILLITDLLGIESFGEFKNAIFESNDKLKVTLSKMLEINGKWSGSYGFFAVISLLTLLNEKQLKEFKKQSIWAEKLWRITKESLNI